MEACPKCGAKVETPLGCGACGLLFSPAAPPGPFAVLGFEPTFALDPAELRRRLLRVGRIVHPDYFSTADAATRERAERSSALLNEAYATLADPAQRADWLVRWLGGPTEREQREMPRSFLAEVLDWNEVLEAARHAGVDTVECRALDELRATLCDRRSAVLASVGASLTPLPDRGAASLAEVRGLLNALRYMETMLAQIDAHALEQHDPL